MTLESLPDQYIKETIGIPIEIISNEFNDFMGNTHHKIIFQIKEDEPDLFAFSVLFTLSLMSFTYSAPRGFSEYEFIPDEDWNLVYFLRGMSFENGNLKFSGDYVSGRHMKTDIVYEPGGKITISTRNRGRGADRWMAHIQGKAHIKEIK